MDSETFASEAIHEETHWWFVGRRRLFTAELNLMDLPSNSAILDVGTSTGTNLRMLRGLGYTNVSGLDFSVEAIQFCENKGFTGVYQGDICSMPFDDGVFDLVLATDIIEHVDDDRKALAEIERVLKPGGRGVITVPAFDFLWGLQDRVAQHKRRYTINELLSAIRTANLNIITSYYFNYILFVPIFIARRIIDTVGIKARSEADINNVPLNFFLKYLFKMDVLSSRRIKPPFGVSALAIVEKKPLPPPEPPPPQ